MQWSSLASPFYLVFHVWLQFPKSATPRSINPVSLARYVFSSVCTVTFREDISLRRCFDDAVIHKLELRTLKSLKSHGGVDRALFSFDLDVDFRPAFHWNIKQLFTYVVASYETESKKINQVVIHDKIIEAIHPEDMVLKYDEKFVKYALVDQGDDLRGKDVKLQLMWDHMPITGLLYMGEQPLEGASTFTLPAEYQ
jgi:signal peptidase complex subunit 3